MTIIRFAFLLGAVGIFLGGVSSPLLAQSPIRNTVGTPSTVQPTAAIKSASATGVVAQRPFNFDFTNFSGNADSVVAIVTDPVPSPLASDVTVAISSVTGSESNPGTLDLPKRSLQQPAPVGSVFGLYRGSLFRDSLPFSSLGTTHGIVVEDLSTGPNATGTTLPIISALDPAANGSFNSNGDGTYSYVWTPAETLVNDGYNNVYVVEINTTTEAATPVASRRRMIDVSDNGGVVATAGSVLVQSLSGGRWLATLHPSDGFAPGNGAYRYEVVSRFAPADWGPPNNTGDGTMSGIELVGSSWGYGSLGGPPNFVGDRLAILHASTHSAVLGGGSLQRSVFYEQGNQSGGGPSIQLAWYTGNPAGLRWETRHCLFYANVGDRAANCLISHSAGVYNYDRGDISDTAFIGARWSDGSLHGTAIEYDNVNTGVIERIYVQAIQDIFGFNMPVSTEVRNSVFQQVGIVRVGGNFHDNVVLAETIADPASASNAPANILFQQSGASATNNILWARGVPGATAGNGESVSGIQFYNGAPAVANCTCQRNIIVLNAANSAVSTYYNPGSSNTASMAVDYNLIINLSKAGFHAEDGAGLFTFAAYQAAYGLDQHSLYVDLSADPRGIQAVFADPINGDFRWAQTDVGSQCAAYCQANNVGPATVTTHWPTVPTVDEAVAAISLLPPKLTSPVAITFTEGAYGGYQITTNLDGTSGAPTSYSATGLPTGLSVNTTSGVISGTPSQAGTCNVTVSATNTAGTGSAVVGITVQTAYMAWQQAYFTAAELSNPAISGPNATPAGDGIPNLTKYALGLNPKSVGTGGLPTISLTAAGGSNFLTLTYNRSLAASDVTYTVEVSGDLQAWSSGASDTATVNVTNNATNTLQTVVQRDLTPTSSAGRRFIRLKISQP